MWSSYVNLCVLLLVGVNTPITHAHDPSVTTFITHAHASPESPTHLGNAHLNHPESVEDQAAVLEAMREDCEVRMREEIRLLKQLRTEARVRGKGVSMGEEPYGASVDFPGVENIKSRTRSSDQPSGNMDEGKDDGSRNKHPENQLIKAYNNNNQNVKENGSAAAAFCPTTFDDVYCWPRTPPDTLVTIPCPTYVQGFPHGSHASRYCTSQGTWFRLDGGNSSWTNYTQCSTMYVLAENVNITLFKWVPVVRVVSYVGYSVSLVTLVVAFTVLACIKRLRCPRNTLHMHLFLSFICRAVGALARDKQHGLLTLESPETYMEKSTWACRVFTGTWQYFILANYAWILMEGLYLHNLIFLALFTDNSAITLYIVLGWGMPLVLVLGWVAARITSENTLCWLTNESPWVFWTFIRGPISVSILVSFALFLNIARELLLKLRSSTTPESRKYRYRRWARSTLVLVPLFGVHYAALLGFTYFMGKNHTMELIWLFTDQFFASFQGFFVATLYCLMNAEVRSELRKVWQHWRIVKGSESINIHSAFSQSRTYFSRGTATQGAAPTTSRRKLEVLSGRGDQCSLVRAVRANGTTTRENSFSLHDKSVFEDTDNQLVTVNLAVVELQQNWDAHATNAHTTPTSPWYETHLGTTTSLDSTFVLQPMAHTTQKATICVEDSTKPSATSSQGIHENPGSDSGLELPPPPPSGILYDMADSCEGSPLLVNTSHIAESTF
ncbi:vasoactive intestinal polypeptide receptor 1-like [Cherax quadricarinatus]|uniref:vasoactive intestinal polypeptide receptor 1-like n=1 Tax=Cherax quadricarinatus TaxID=27406 RepID=UPI00387E4586